MRALNGALVLCADHELATSTFAVRVAASTRANPYAAVGAGLGALDGPLHGTVSELVHASSWPTPSATASTPPWRAGSATATASPASATRSYPGRRPPGPRPPRPAARRPASTPLGGSDVAAAVLDAVVGRTGVRPELGLRPRRAGLRRRHEPPDAGEAVFAIGRCAGWLAHAMEEYAEAPLRFRLRARTRGRDKPNRACVGLTLEVKATGKVDT